MTPDTRTTENPTECGHFTVQSDHPDWRCLRCGERFLPIAEVHHIVATEAGVQRADDLFGKREGDPDDR